MKNITEYQFVTTCDESVDDTMAHFIALGWQPFGSPLFDMHGNISQAMVKYGDQRPVLSAESDDATGMRIVDALNVASQHGGIDGDHHKTWVVAQMVRALCGEHYEQWVVEQKDGEDGPDTYGWDEGIAP